jgi:hypothetical protein
MQFFSFIEKMHNTKCNINMKKIIIRQSRKLKLYDVKTNEMRTSRQPTSNISRARFFSYHKWPK